MADDWQSGDLAWCLRKPGPSAPFQVCGTYCVLHVYDMWGTELLDFVCTDITAHNGGKPAGWPARYFRKIRPHTPDAEDRETIALLNGAPVKEPVA